MSVESFSELESLAVPTNDPVPTNDRVRAAAFEMAVTPGGSVTITVRGEIDASNTGELAELAQAGVRAGGRLVLDCSEVTFFAVEGFSTMQRVNVICAQAGVAWVLLPSAAVTRVLHLFATGAAVEPIGAPATVCSAGAAGSPRLRLVRGV